MSNGGGELAARVAVFFIGVMLLTISFLILPFGLYVHDQAFGEYSGGRPRLGMLRQEPIQVVGECLFVALTERSRTAAHLDAT